MRFSNTPSEPQLFNVCIVFPLLVLVLFVQMTDFVHHNRMEHITIRTNHAQHRIQHDFPKACCVYYLLDILSNEYALYAILFCIKSLCQT